MNTIDQWYNMTSFRNFEAIQFFVTVIRREKKIISIGIFISNTKDLNERKRKYYHDDLKQHNPMNAVLFHIHTTGFKNNAVMKKNLKTHMTGVQRTFLSRVISRSLPDFEMLSLSLTSFKYIVE